MRDTALLAQSTTIGAMPVPAHLGDKRGTPRNLGVTVSAPLPQTHVLDRHVLADIVSVALATIPHLGERLAYKKTTASVTEMRGNNSKRFKI